MNETLLLLAWIIPVTLAGLTPLLQARWWLPLAPLPALLNSVLMPVNTQGSAPWLLMGMHFGLDELNQPFILFSSLVWLLALLYLVIKQPQYAATAMQRAFLLLALSGNIILLFASDMATFFVGYALMGLSAYPLILQGRSQQARMAGKVYLAWTMLGEVLIFSAILMIASQAGTTRFDAIHSIAPPDAAVLLTIIGFGIKLGLPLLHHWLPMSYHAAPAVLVAILSAPLMNAGLLGWLRFLPLGHAGMDFWGLVLIAAGGSAVIFGSILGILQHRPRIILAYSSMAKMGVLALFIGIALLFPQASEALLVAIVIYALHHLMVKGLLFLGVAEWENGGAQYNLLALFIGLGLSLAAFPLTLGATAKTLLLEATPEKFSSEISLLLLLSATLTTLLMLRFMFALTARTGIPSVLCSPVALILTTIMLAMISMPFWTATFSLSTSGLTGIVSGILLFAILYRPIRKIILPSPFTTPFVAWRLLRRKRPTLAHISNNMPTFGKRLPDFTASMAGTGSMAVSGAFWLAVMLLILLLFALT